MAIKKGVMHMLKIISYHDISPSVLKESHLSGLVISIRLRKLPARVFGKWVATRERLESNVRRNDSALLMMMDCMVMSLCEMAIRIMFPRLRYVMAYILHFHASCSSEYEKEVVNFTIMPLPR